MMTRTMDTIAVTECASALDTTSAYS